MNLRLSRDSAATYFDSLIHRAVLFPVQCDLCCLSKNREGEALPLPLIDYPDLHRFYTAAF